MNLLSYRILIVAPDDDFRKSLGMFFGKRLKCLILCETVEESAKTVRENEYDAIICDYSHVRMSGSGFFRLVGEFQPDAEIIIIHDNDIEDDIPGNYSLIRKPFSVEEIEALVKIPGNRALEFHAPVPGKTAETIVRNHVIAAMGAGLVPVPLVDMAALTGIQLSMLKRLARVFGIPFCRDRGKHVAATLLGSALPSLSTGPVVSFFKTVPVVGQVFGALVMPVSGGAATYALGRVFIQHFASGGTFLNLDPDRVREYYAEMLKVKLET